MSRFHHLRVKTVKIETEDTVSFTLDIPEELKDRFEYKQGQYLTFKKRLNGKELRRSYSFCSCPLTDPFPKVAVKQIPNGQFSTWINTYLTPDTYLDVMEPAGNFYTALNPGQQKHYLAISGGSGITPFMSIIKTTLLVEKDSTFTLFYGSKTDRSIIFKEDLAQMMDEFEGRLKVIHVLSEEAGESELQSGLMTTAKLSSLWDHYLSASHPDEVFICGPGPVLENARALLDEKDFPKERIHFELFQSPDDGDELPSASPDLEEVNSFVTVILDGDEFEFQLSSRGESILDAAMEAGADVPFSCKGAVCATCRAKVIEGKARMEKNYALSEKEIEEGFILTCQSRPLTEKLVVDYDEF